MAHFAVVKSDIRIVKLRHIEQGHEYEFGFLRPDGGDWHEPHLLSQTEGDGATGAGLAELYLDEARCFAAAIHAGEPRT